MDLIIHIGDAKCGSSSIQASLYESKESLLNEKVLYNPVYEDNGHYSYATLLGRKIRGDIDKHKSDSLRNIKQTQELINKEKPEYLLISGENLFGIPAKEIIDLAFKIDKKIDKIHVISYVRKPSDFYLSSIQQTLKADHLFQNPNTFKRDLYKPFDRWENEKLCNSIHVRNFSKSSLYQQSVVLDFQKTLQKITNKSSICLPNKVINTTITSEQMITLQRIRENFYFQERGIFKDYSNHVLRLFLELNGLNESITKPKLKKEVIRKINQNNQLYINNLTNKFPHLKSTSLNDINNEKKPTQEVSLKLVDILDNLNNVAVEKWFDLLEVEKNNPKITNKHKILEELYPHKANKAIDIYERFINKINKKNILILGTSNSILRGGWSSGFNEWLSEKYGDSINIKNASIGGSPGLQFSHWCTKDLSSYDYIIFDSIVNDENMLQRGYIGTFDYYKEIMSEILSTLASQSNLIVLGFCNERHSINKSDVYHFQKQISDKIGASFISVIDHALQGSTPTYRDGAHISLINAKEFGFKLAKDIFSINNKNINTVSFKENFKSIKIKDISNYKTYTKKSNILNQEFVEIGESSSLSFNQNERLIGFQIDTSNTYTYISLIGNNYEKNFSLKHQLNSEKFIASFVPIPDAPNVNRIEVLDLQGTAIPTPNESVNSGILSLSYATFWLNKP